MKRTILVAVTTMILVIGFVNQSFGQFKDKGVRIGIAGGYLMGLTKMDVNDLSIASRIFLRHNIADYFDGDLSGSIGQVKGDYYQSDLLLVEYKILYKPFTCDDWDPYAGAGLGLLFFDANKILRDHSLPSDGYVGYLPFALGTEYALSDDWQLDANVNFNYSFSNKIVSTCLSGTKIGTGNDAWWGIYVGISYSISGNGEAEKEAMRVKAEQDALHARELAVAEAKRVQDSINAVAAEAARLKEAQLAEAQRVQDSIKAVAEAQRIRDSIDAAEAQRIAESKKPVALKAEVGKAIVLEGVVFPSGKATISPESEQILSSAKKTMEDNPDLKVEIRGYTDNVGNAKKNLQLSQARADAVKAWLVKNGIDSTRITAKGYGDKNPRGDNKTADGRKMNRRIEFLRTK